MEKVDSPFDRSDQRFRSSPDFVIVRKCRLVCKYWCNIINSIFKASGKPLLVIDPTRKLPATHLISEAILGKIQSVLVRPLDLQPEQSNLPMPMIHLSLPLDFFRGEIETEFVCNILPYFNKQIRELYIKFPFDSNFTYLWPDFDLSQVDQLHFYVSSSKKRRPANNPWIKPKFFVQGQCIYLIHQLIKNCTNLSSLEIQGYLPSLLPSLEKIALQPSICHLDLPLISIDSDDVSKYPAIRVAQIVKSLVLRAPRSMYALDFNDNANYGNVLLKNFKGTLERLSLHVSGEIYRDHVIPMMSWNFTPLELDFSLGLQKLVSLEICAAPWKIGNLESFQLQLPSLRSLVLHHIHTSQQLGNLCSLRSTSITDLDLSFSHGIPVQVINDISINFTALTKLKVRGEATDPGLIKCFYLRPTITHLEIDVKLGNTGNGVELIRCAITGLTHEDYYLVESGQLSLYDAITTRASSMCLRSRIGRKRFENE